MQYESQSLVRDNDTDTIDLVKKVQNQIKEKKYTRAEVTSKVHGEEEAKIKAEKGKNTKVPRIQNLTQQEKQHKQDHDKDAYMDANIDQIGRNEDLSPR